MSWDHYCISYRSLTHCWLLIHYWLRNFKLLRFIYQVLILFWRELLNFPSFQIKIGFYPGRYALAEMQVTELSSGAIGWNIMTYGKWSEYIIRLPLEPLRSVSLWGLAEVFLLFESALLYTVISYFLKKSSSRSSEAERIPKNNYLLLQLYW